MDPTNDTLSGAYSWYGEIHHIRQIGHGRSRPFVVIITSTYLAKCHQESLLGIVGRPHATSDFAGLKFCHCTVRSHCADGIVEG